MAQESTVMYQNAPLNMKNKTNKHGCSDTCVIYEVWGRYIRETMNSLCHQKYSTVECLTTYK